MTKVRSPGTDLRTIPSRCYHYGPKASAVSAFMVGVLASAQISMCIRENKKPSLRECAFFVTLSGLIGMDTYTRLLVSAQSSSTLLSVSDGVTVLGIAFWIKRFGHWSQIESTPR
jgi:hypothetical protein